MLDTHTEVQVHHRDTAALSVEAGVRVTSRKDVHYIRRSQVARLESDADDVTVVHFFEGRALVLYGTKVDDVATALGWKA